MTKKKTETKVACLVLLPRKTADYLDKAAAEIQSRYGCRSGKATILRGLADAISEAQFPIVDAGATSFHLTACLVQSLCANGPREGK